MPVNPDAYIRDPLANMNSGFPFAPDYLVGVAQGRVPHDTSIDLGGVAINYDPEELAAAEHATKLHIAGLGRTYATTTPHAPFLDDGRDAFVDFHTRGIEHV